MNTHIIIDQSELMMTIEILRTLTGSLEIVDLGVCSQKQLKWSRVPKFLTQTICDPKFHSIR